MDEVKKLTNIYGVIYARSHWANGTHPVEMQIPDGAGEDIECAQGWAEEVVEPDDLIAIVTHTLNINDFWVGYFFYNDMEDGEDASPVECNTREHLDAHWETNNSGGHYDCTKYEHLVNGKVIETITHDR